MAVQKSFHLHVHTSSESSPKPPASKCDFLEVLRLWVATTRLTARSRECCKDPNRWCRQLIGRNRYAAWLNEPEKQRRTLRTHVYLLKRCFWPPDLVESFFFEYFAITSPQISLRKHAKLSNIYAFELAATISIHCCPCWELGWVLKITVQLESQRDCRAARNWSYAMTSTNLSGRDGIWLSVLQSVFLFIVLAREKHSLLI